MQLTKPTRDVKHFSSSEVIARLGAASRLGFFFHARKYLADCRRAMLNDDRFLSITLFQNSTPVFAGTEITNANGGRVSVFP